MLRRGLFAALAVLSTVGALALAYAAFGPGSVGLTPTIALVGIFVLLVFPSVTVWAWFWDRNIRKRTEHLTHRRRRPMLVEHAGGRHTRKPAADPRPTHQTIQEQDT